MIKALFTSATGLNAQQTLVDTTANNLANVNTTGFKRSTVEFKDLIYVTEQVPGTQTGDNVFSPTGIQVGSGTRIGSTSKVFTPGVLQNTDNPFDVAIEGDGFFRVTLPDGTLRYTRDGAFRLSQTGQLVTTDGFALDPAITIPTDALSVTIGADGTVSVVTPANLAAPTTVGQITLSRFANPSGLSSEGNNLYSETFASGPATTAPPGQQGLGFLRQRFLERSNVEVVQELINLIIAQRAYEFNTRSIRTADSILEATNGLVR
jgi:flagellar basal-body rod protein FlgG